MRRLVSRAAVVMIVATLVCVGCSTASPQSDEVVSETFEEPEYMMSDQWQSDDAQSGMQASDELPFALNVAPDSLESALEASSVEVGVDYQLLGQTDGKLFPSVVLDDGSAFGTENNTAQGDLANIRVTAGIISTQGVFTPLSKIADPMEELPGSNPDKLSFEPQNASAYGDWVVWREGSAGGIQQVPTLESDDWRLVAWNRNASTVKEMASAYLLHGDRGAPYATWDVAPSTDGKFVYFEASVPEGDQWVASILSVPLDSPGNTKVLSEGTTPFADQHDGGVFFVRDNSVVKDDATLFSVDSHEWQIGKLTGSKDLLAATVSNGDAAWLLIWDIGERRMITAIETGSDWAYVSAAEKSVVWGNGSGNGNPAMYRWTTDSRIDKFGSLQGLSIPVTNGYEVVFPHQNDEGGIDWEFTAWR